MNKITNIKLKLTFTTMALLALSIYTSPIVVSLARQFLTDYGFLVCTLIAILLTCFLVIIFILTHLVHFLKSTKKTVVPSSSVVRSLKRTKYSSMVLSVLYTLLLPFIYILAEKDDAPGLILFFLAPLLLSVFLTYLTSNYLK